MSDVDGKAGQTSTPDWVPGLEGVEVELVEVVPGSSKQRARRCRDASFPMI